MKTYFWDFFGPRARGTAEHFQKHLHEFLEKKGLTGCQTALVSEGPGHTGVACETPSEFEGVIERELSPKRSR